MTLQSRIWWILASLLAILFVIGGWLRTDRSPVVRGVPGFVAYDVAPRPVNVEQVGKMIGYPDKAWRAGIQGQVVLRVWISDTGHYERHEGVHSDHPLLRMACEVHLPLLRFEPAMKSGLAVPSEMEIPFMFSLSR
mgnify:CR=1 FL=1